MERLNCITKRSKYKHFSERERYKLEGYIETKVSIKEDKSKGLTNTKQQFIER